MARNSLDVSFFRPEGDELFSIILIGMAGAGKTTIGRILAQLLCWAHLDTDRLMESYYGIPIQKLMDSFGMDGFRRAEEHVVGSLMVNRCVVSTGGSVVYSPDSMERLQSLGPVLFLDAPFEYISGRLEDTSDRGLVIESGQSLEELYRERLPLYRQYADKRIDLTERQPEETARYIMDLLSLNGEGK